MLCRDNNFWRTTMVLGYHLPPNNCVVCGGLLNVMQYDLLCTSKRWTSRCTPKIMRPQISYQACMLGSNNFGINEQ